MFTFTPDELAVFTHARIDAAHRLLHRDYDAYQGDMCKHGSDCVQLSFQEWARL